MKTLKERAKFRMNVLGIKEPALPALIPHVPQQSLSNVLNGKSSHPKFIIELAHALQTTAEWLLTGKGPMDTKGQDKDFMEFLGRFIDYWAKETDKSVPARELFELAQDAHKECKDEPTKRQNDEIRKVFKWLGRTTASDKPMNGETKR